VIVIDGRLMLSTAAVEVAQLIDIIKGNHIEDD